MNIIVRLYWQHDLDLVALCMHPDFDMGIWMKKAVVAFAKGDAGFRIPLPRSIPYHVNLDNCCTHFSLSPEKEADVIACMNGFRYGQRNSAIRNIFRMYLEAPYMEPYYNEKMYAVKARGSAKEGDTDVVKTQVVPVSKPEPKPSLEPSVKEFVEKTSTSAVVEPVRVNNEEPKVKENVNDISPSVPAPLKPISNPVVTETPYENPVIDDYDESEGDSDGFDLFGALGDMMN